MIAADGCMSRKGGRGTGGSGVPTPTGGVGEGGEGWRVIDVRLTGRGFVGLSK